MERAMREDLTVRLKQFQERYPVDASVQGRVAKPPVEFIGEEILELAVSALLQGENILLCGGKATGKNILADNLAWLFARPVYNVSFHVNTDSGTLIGTDTFTGGEVRLRRGPVAQAAQYGGFCILDEINMAKNDAVAVMHAALDYRRLIDVPGYECIPMHPAARFIATMNYGYAGTRELNEALVSRFTVIRMPVLPARQLIRLLRTEVPNASEENLERCVGLFLDLNEKAVNGEISTHPVDLRGMTAALRLMTDGLKAKTAIAAGVTNKCFDEYEYQLVQDVVMTRFA
ncbi:MAG: MoxR family ATPase [Lawsonibacter sp.]|nr:MoxR family ATPase [Lawsonibacter sp.]